MKLAIYLAGIPAAFWSGYGAAVRHNGGAEPLEIPYFTLMGTAAMGAWIVGYPLVVWRG